MPEWLEQASVGVVAMVLYALTVWRWMAHAANHTEHNTRALEQLSGVIQGLGKAIEKLGERIEGCPYRQ